MELGKALQDNFVWVNLGSGSDRDYGLPVELKKLITLVEVDAADKSKTTSIYFKRHSLQSGIAPQAGRRIFRQNRFVGCSSLSSPKEDLIRRYGLEEYYEVERLIELDCVTLPSVLASFSIDRMDFLKTDLEGLDYEVLKSCEHMLADLLAIQCELRFEPFYEKEPYFHEVCAFLYSHHFELIELRPEYWKPKTRHGCRHRDGRLVWADCIFLKDLESGWPEGRSDFSLAVAKQIIICSMLGHHCYGEFLFERYKSDLSTTWIPLLETLIEPRRPHWKSLLKATYLGKVLIKIKRAWSRRNFNFDHVVDR